MKDYFFTRDDEYFEIFLRNGRARGNLVVEITFDGPVDQFLQVGASSPWPYDKFVLGPGTQKKLKWDVKDLARLIDQYDVDQLYGARFRIKAFPEGIPKSIVLDETINVFRFLSVVDPNGQTNQAKFYRAFADGPGGFIREKLIEYHLPTQCNIFSQLGTHLNSEHPSAAKGSAGGSSIPNRRTVIQNPPNGPTTSRSLS